MQKIYDRHGCVSAKGLLKMMNDAADKCDACHEAMADEVERLRELLDAERDRAAGIENQYKLTGDQVDVPEARKVGGAGWDETLVGMVRRLVMDRGLLAESLHASKAEVERLKGEVSKRDGWVAGLESDLLRLTVRARKQRDALMRIRACGMPKAEEFESLIGDSIP